MSALTILSSSIRQDEAGRYSLNDCWRAAGSPANKTPAEWGKNAQTRALVAEICQKGNSPSEKNQPLNVINGGSASGTYGVRQLVYAYGEWISAAFHLKVLEAFDAMVRGEIPATATPSFNHITLIRKAIALHGSTLAYHKRQGMDVTQARLKANAVVKEQTGVDLPKVLGWQAQPLVVQERTMTATQIGAELGISNRDVNQLLKEQGFHNDSRDAKNRIVWTPTEKGRRFGRYEDKTKAHTQGTVQPWVWFPLIVDVLRPFAKTPEPAL
ncbi:KilA-N domain-containing protein [Acetobacter sacchari]|uniref:KilA-N domain-containing protein n=1 Tax=Acetobacter sacchari TaxID=2661687 RepID=A0ABS3M0P8_9PROT|nr:KilA-N domain-containing protein [Acetobacter sacchari]MBO1361766.1 KilA-N domain-containing protein [Acetobacter sacchari]